MSEQLRVESLDLDAQGIAHKTDGKVVFIDGALPFEVVSVNTYRKKDSFEKAILTHIHKESNQRVKPRCPHFGLEPQSCGGCKLQHMDAAAQVATKQRALEDQITHIGRAKPESLLRPIAGPSWGYRYRARLSVRYVIKKDEVMIGFHERKSRYIANMTSCAVLPQFVSDLLLPMRALIKGMDARETCPQIEVACGDKTVNGQAVLVVALVLRHLEPLSSKDLQALSCFASEQGTATSRIQWWLQPKGPDTVKLLEAIDPAHALGYELPEFGVRMPFKPTDFTQVNPQINQVLVSQALQLLDVQSYERVIDWFCGLGNFTLPLATKAKEVLGIEGSEALVQRAKDNAKGNGLAAKADFKNVDFVMRNLFEMDTPTLCADGVADKWLIDPPREGAFALVKALASAIKKESLEGEEGAMPVPVAVPAEWVPPKRIVYVSCNPATLARDTNILVNVAGYRLLSVGAVNMFPHTAHVESMAVFQLA